MLACHAGGPGSIPGRRKSVIFFVISIDQHADIVLKTNIRWTRIFNLKENALEPEREFEKKTQELKADAI